MVVRDTVGRLRSSMPHRAGPYVMASEPEPEDERAASRGLRSAEEAAWILQPESQGPHDEDDPTQLSRVTSDRRGMGQHLQKSLREDTPPKRVLLAAGSSDWSVHRPLYAAVKSGHCTAVKPSCATGAIPHTACARAGRAAAQDVFLGCPAPLAESRWGLALGLEHRRRAPFQSAMSL